MQFYFKAQSQHDHSMLQLAVELARIRSFFGDAPYRGAPATKRPRHECPSAVRRGRLPCVSGSCRCPPRGRLAHASTSVPLVPVLVAVPRCWL